MNRALTLFGIAALSTGCVGDYGAPAPSGSTLTGPDEIAIGWSAQLNGYDDGLGLLALIQWNVFDPNARHGEGMPLANTEVEFISGSTGVYLLPEAAIRQVTPPDSSNSDCTIGSEFYDVRTCPWYDDATQSYFQLSSNYSSDEGEDPEALFRPNYMVAATDQRGIVRMWVYIDSLGTSTGDSFSSATVYGSIGVDSAVATFSVGAE